MKIYQNVRKAVNNESGYEIEPIGDYKGFILTSQGIVYYKTIYNENPIENPSYLVYYLLKGNQNFKNSKF